MEQRLDFREIRRPCLRLTMRDDDNTEFRILPASLGMVKDLLDAADDLHSALRGTDQAQIMAAYQSAAQLISHNRDGVIVTGRELRTKYDMDLEDLTVFFSAYLDFIQALNAEKNG